MSNHGWVNYDQQKPPDGESVLVLFDRPIHGTRYAVYSSVRISNGYMVVVNGLLLWDSPDRIVAWRNLDDISLTIPEEYLV